MNFPPTIWTFNRRARRNIHVNGFTRNELCYYFDGFRSCSDAQKRRRSNRPGTRINSYHAVRIIRNLDVATKLSIIKPSFSLYLTLSISFYYPLGSSHSLRPDHRITRDISERTTINPPVPLSKNVPQIRNNRRGNRQGATRTGLPLYKVNYVGFGKNDPIKPYDGPRQVTAGIKESIWWKPFRNC